MTVIPFQEARGRWARVASRRAKHPSLALAARILAQLREWRRRVRDRAELTKLDERMLRDIGLTAADAEFLSSKPFWRREP